MSMEKVGEDIAGRMEESKVDVVMALVLAKLVAMPAECVVCFEVRRRRCHMVQAEEGMGSCPGRRMERKGCF